MSCSLGEIAELLLSKENILLMPHISADGDAVGSCLALATGLTELGKTVKVCLEEQMAGMYKFLPGQHYVSVASDTCTLPSDCIAVALDSGDENRLGSRLSTYKSAVLTVNIDHHASNTKFAQYNYIDTKASSVGEIIYDLLKLTNATITKDIADCIYTAISTDTGGFRYVNTTAQTHQIVSELIKKGTKPAAISQRVFDFTTLSRTRLMGTAIASLNLYENGRIAVMSITVEDMQKTGAKDEDCEGIVNIGRNIDGVEVSALLREKGNNEIRVNLRSSTYFNVAAIAGANGGGGHKNAAGYTAQGTISEVSEYLVNLMRGSI